VTPDELKELAKKLQSAQLKYQVAKLGGYPEGELSQYRLIVKQAKKRFDDGVAALQGAK
jgi:hypothetical protein